MSQENVERYHRLLAAWNQGDIDELVARAFDDVVIHTALAGVEGDYRGHNGMRRWWHDFHDVFPDWHAEALVVRAAGDATVAQLHLTGHGGGSGAPVNQTMWHVTRWQEGRAAQISRYDSEAEALEAVGLSE